MKIFTATNLARVVLPGLLLGFTAAGPLSAAALPEWSNSARDITPIGGRVFLGQFGAEMVSLSLPSLPPHSKLMVSADLFVIRTWDGNDYYSGGPDIWELGLPTSPTPALTTSFHNFPECIECSQSYPDFFPEGNYPPQTGASETGSLGYEWDGPRDAVYKLAYTFDHSGDAAQVNFSAGGEGFEDIGNESWGLDNVKVEVEDGSGQTQVVYQNDFESSIQPTNDLRSNATVMSALPFSDLVDTRTATTTPDEPTGCPNSNLHSVWYTFTPTKDLSFRINSSGSNYTTAISAWTKSRKGLTQVACGTNDASFDVIAGTTYYLMVGGVDGGLLRLAADEAFAVRIKVDPNGTVDRLSGIAAITGTLTCSQPASINRLDGTLSQRAGRFSVFRGGFDYWPWGSWTCSPSSPYRWSAEISGNGPFNAGAALANVHAWVCGAPGCLDPTIESEVRLGNR